MLVCEGPSELKEPGNWEQEKRWWAKVLRLKPVILGSHKALPRLSAGCSRSSLINL